MSTTNPTTPIAQTNDATNRVWVSEVSTNLDLYLPATADTGQINLATFVRAAINTAAGYQIRRMDDTMQATAPVFFKFEYGSGAAQDRPAVWVTIGTGSNGSGTITGIFFPRTLISGSNLGALISTSTNLPSPYCGVDGAFAMCLKIGAYGINVGSTSTSLGLLSFQRTTDASGTPTAEGCTVHFSDPANSRTAAYSTNFATSSTVGPATSYTSVPYNITATLVSGAPQPFAHVHTLPEVRPCAFSLTVLSSGTEVPDGTQFTATPVGLVAKNYLSLGNAGGGASAVQTGAHRFCMIYE